MTGWALPGAPGAQAAVAPASAATTGYWAIGAAGQAEAFHSASYGDMSSVQLASPMVGGAAAGDGRGYWLVGADGGVFAFGSAAFHGSLGGQSLPAPIVAMAADPATGGYWLVDQDGTVYGEGAPTFGDALPWGLLSPIVGMAATADGGGYWLVTSAGGVFAFGDAKYAGSMGGRHLASPVVGMAANPADSSDGSYWLVSAAGGVFSFGAGYYGSMGGRALAAPVTGVSPSFDGRGYWLTGRAGAVYAFGDAPFYGAAQPAMGATATVGIISTGTAAEYPHNSTGYDVSQWQCPAYAQGASYPSGSHGFGVAQVSGGNIDSTQPSGCYAQEAAWAGPNEMAYIFMDPPSSSDASNSMSGPAGTCANSDLSCQYFNYGYSRAVYWVNYAHSQGTDPLMFWLDVELGAWATDSSSQALNSREITGAIDGLEAAGQIPGIYSTNYQFQQITGGGVWSPGIALWMAGAQDLSQAESFCSGNNGYNGLYNPFAGGTIEMAQWVSGNVDYDYACP